MTPEPPYRTLCRYAVQHGMERKMALPFVKKESWDFWDCAFLYMAAVAEFDPSFITEMKTLALSHPMLKGEKAVAPPKDIMDKFAQLENRYMDNHNS